MVPFPIGMIVLRLFLRDTYGKVLISLGKALVRPLARRNHSSEAQIDPCLRRLCRLLERHELREQILDFPAALLDFFLALLKVVKYARWRGSLEVLGLLLYHVGCQPLLRQLVQ